MTIRSILSAILLVAPLILSEAASPIPGNGNPAVAHATKAYANLATHFDSPNAKIDKDITIMLKKMSLKEKIGQMTQLNQDQIQMPDGTFNWTQVEYLAKNYYIGSYLNNMNA
ncbi:hypothetical protein BC937DRAFT_94979 [Endogone sp. FLAS-F59071]|nr:hypothetical protein BC937DRAFT_94979 [Endogone sp. FLAS-F59071]|eukprot:RUS20544.1 hypothetical protein BC937DRAFT_94979 [Endogone sp. FLAS-F59071]